MKMKRIKQRTGVLLMGIMLGGGAIAQQTIAEWDFTATNNTTINGGIASPQPSTGVGTATLLGVTASLAAGPIGVCNASDGSGCAWNTTTYAAQSAESGERGVQFAVSTLGYENIHFTFEQRASGTGSRYSRVDYSLNGGSNWVTGFWDNSGGLSPHDVFYSFSVDFTAVTAANDNPDFMVRIVSIFAPCDFVQNTTLSYSANTAYMRANADAACQPHIATTTGNYGAAGTWRFDNVKFAGNVIGVAVEPVELSASATMGTEANETVINITATVANNVVSAETVTLSVGGTNINMQDYMLSNNNITIAAGSNVGSVTFTIVNDNLNEGPETAVISIASTSGGLSIGTISSVSVDIVDNDAFVELLDLGFANPMIDFNEMQISGTNLFDVTKGFYLFEQGANANTVYRADAGVSTTGDTYSYGDVGSNERALGSLTTGSLTPNAFGARLRNSTGSDVNLLTVIYTGEQWRVGSAGGDSLHFAFSTDATSLSNGTWTEIPELNFGALHIAGAGVALDGNDPANQTNFNFDFSGFTLMAGGEMWIRWVDFDVTGGDHGLSVDNLILIPEYIPQPTLILSHGNLLAFSHVIGTPSAEEVIEVYAYDLSMDVIVDAPAEYEISLTSGGPFSTSLSIPQVGGIVGPIDLYVRLNGSVVGAHSGDLAFSFTPTNTDYLPVSGNTLPVPTPTITVSTNSLTGFSQVLGSPSAEQMFTVSGADLTDDIMLTAPADFEISETSGSGFGAAITLAHTSGTVATTTIYVRLNASVANTFSGQIEAASTGATSELISLDGTATLPTPVIMVSPSTLVSFNHVVGTPSAEQILTVSGTNLQADVVVDAPASFEVSLTSGSGFGSSVMLTQTAGTLNATSVFVRMNASTVGAHSGDIEATSLNATTILVPVSGNASSGVSVQEMNTSTITIYPNPVNDVLNVSASTQIVQITVFDAAGRMVDSKTLNNEQFTTINTEVLSAGMYTIQILTTDGMVTAKFIK